MCSRRVEADGRGALPPPGAFAAASLIALPGAAHAGFLDFLFGGFQQQPAPPVNSYAEPPASTSSSRRDRRGRARRAAGAEAVTAAIACGFATGITFPLEHMANATPIETCRAMCPASQTKVFFGSGIDHAAARDGQRYTDLDSAYVYRDHLVANCTCNGRDAFGLAPFEATSDPTLRAGDIVATKGGILAYTGRRGQGAAFSPVDRGGGRCRAHAIIFTRAADQAPGAAAGRRGGAGDRSCGPTPTRRPICAVRRRDSRRLPAPATATTSAPAIRCRTG